MCVRVCEDQVTSHHVSDLQRLNSNKDYHRSPTIHPGWNAHSERRTHTWPPPPHTQTHTFSACICCVLTAGETTLNSGSWWQHRVTEVTQTKRHHVVKKNIPIQSESFLLPPFYAFVSSQNILSSLSLHFHLILSPRMMRTCRA